MVGFVNLPAARSPPGLVVEGTYLLAFLGALVDEALVNMRDHTSTGDRCLDEGIELLVTTDGKLEMAGRDALDLEILGRVAGKLEDFSSEVLHDGCCVHSGRGADALALGCATLQVAVDTSDRELKSGAA